MFSFLVIVEFLRATFAFAGEAGKVIDFSPQGTVKQVRQIKATFNQPMVPFGNLEAASEPFLVQCNAPGKSHWADSKNWIFDFDKDLPAGVKCDLKLKDNLTTLSGESVKGQKSFSFSTGGPSIIQVIPELKWGTVQEDAAFILFLNGEISDSLAETAYFMIEGLRDKIPLKILSGPEREKILKSQHYPDLSQRVNDRTLVIVQAKRTFPPRAQGTLVWTPGENQKQTFSVRDEFSAKFSCEKENSDAGCIPLLPMSLHFTNAISLEDAKKITLRSATGKTFKVSSNTYSNSGEMVNSVKFEGPFPERTQFKVSIPHGLTDESGRRLANEDKFPLEIATDDYPPLAKFSSEFGILESDSSGEVALPVTVRKVETEGAIKGRILKLNPSPSIASVSLWLAKIQGHQWNEKRGESIFATVDGNPGSIAEIHLERPTSEQSLEVMGIPLKGPGLYIVELESRLLGKKLLGADKPMYVSTMALVSPWGVHFKQGRESSLVWVTSLRDASPVANARVTIRDCSGKLIVDGVTGKDGILKVGLLPENTACQQVAGSYSAYRSGFFVSAEKEGEFSFVHTSWNRGIEPWRFNVPTGSYSGSQIAHAVLDRPLYRAGETVSMKLFFRQHTMAGVEGVPFDQLPSFVSVQHMGSDQEYTLPVQWHLHGNADLSWEIPLGAKLGVYQISFKDKEKSPSKTWAAGQFRIEEFRVPLMKGVIHTPSDPIISQKSMNLDLSVEHLSGGAASQLPVLFRMMPISAGEKSFPDFEGFTFSNGPLKSPDASEPTAPSVLKRQSHVLDKTGSARISVELPDNLYEKSGNALSLEMEFRDPNGEVQTVGQIVPLYTSEYQVGIKTLSWSADKSSVKFQVAVLDIRGRPVAKAPVEVEFVRMNTFTHRKKILGGFYAYEHHSELKNFGKACKGITNLDGILSCDVSAPESGEFFLQAKTSDTKKQIDQARTYIYVRDNSQKSAWYPQEDDDRIDVIPEKKRYEAGEKAVFQVKMPFQQASALVTVEREGVLDSYVVQSISSSRPIIEVPIKKNYAPNAYVSVLVVRGRLGDLKPTAIVDLGKPAYKVGLAEVQVGWKAHELKVAVTSERPTYQVREKAKVRIKVRAVDGSLPKNTEAVVAAVDEGLLLLKGNESWKLLDAIMGRRPHEVGTFTAQLELVGKRHFGLKALPAGGGGGVQPTRELFGTLLFWKSKVVLDKNGMATVEIPMNDSITSYRIAVIAHGGLGKFGTGYTTIRSVQDLAILPGISPLVREGDQFPAEFTIRNSTVAPMKVELTSKISGSLPPTDNTESRRIDLEPGMARIVSWPVKIPEGVSSIEYEIEARATGKTVAKDRIKVVQKVVPAVPVRTFQATMQQLEKNLLIPVEQPAGGLKGKGGLSVTLQPTLLSGLSGVADYMKSYPYSCLEQKVSRAIALRDKAQWEKILLELPSYQDRDGLLRYFPNDKMEGSDTLTSFLLAVSAEAEFDIPKENKSKMHEGLKRFIEGSLNRKGVMPAADLTFRKLTALDALSRTGVEVKASQLGSIELSPNDWPTSAVIDGYRVLKRIQDFSGPVKEKKLQEFEQVLKSRLNFQGTQLTFSTEEMDELSWLMVNPEVNLNRLILTRLEFQQPDEDIGRLVRGSLRRQKQGHWGTTTGNAWGVLAMEKFSKFFEKERVEGHSTVALEAQTMDLEWDKTPNGKTFEFGWADKRKDIEVSHAGAGHPWVSFQSSAAIPLTSPLSTGFRIQKTWIPVERKNPAFWSRGDIIKVRLTVDTQASSSWVVLSDPIPAGSSILGSGLGNDSTLSVREERQNGTAWPIFEERSFEAFRSYYEYVPKGGWTVEYTLRLNQQGLMNLPTTRVEAMYAPESFGEIPNAPVQIQE